MSMYAYYCEHDLDGRTCPHCKDEKLAQLTDEISRLQIENTNLRAKLKQQEDAKNDGAKLEKQRQLTYYGIGG